MPDSEALYHDDIPTNGDPPMGDNLIGNCLSRNRQKPIVDYKSFTLASSSELSQHTDDQVPVGAIPEGFEQSEAMQKARLIYQLATRWQVDLRLVMAIAAAAAAALTGT